MRCDATRRDATRRRWERCPPHHHFLPPTTSSPHPTSTDLDLGVDVPPASAVAADVVAVVVDGDADEAVDLVVLVHLGEDELLDLLDVLRRGRLRAAGSSHASRQRERRRTPRPSSPPHTGGPHDDRPPHRQQPHTTTTPTPPQPHHTPTPTTIGHDRATRTRGRPTKKEGAEHCERRCRVSRRGARARVESRRRRPLERRREITTLGRGGVVWCGRKCQLWCVRTRRGAAEVAAVGHRDAIPRGAPSRRRPPRAQRGLRWFRAAPRDARARG